MARRARRIIERIFQESRAEPDWGALPVVTHHMYQASCRAIGRNAGCGECKLCKFHLVLDAVAQAGSWMDEGKPFLPEDRRSHRWPTTSTALADYVAYTIDGYSTPSIHGLLAELGKTGILARTTAPHDSNAIITAEERAAIGEALERAYDEANDRGLGASMCLALLLARRGGVREEARTRWGARYWRTVPAAWGELAAAAGVSELAARGIVESGERRVAIELCARGLVRPPRTPDIGREIEARRGELAARRTGGKGKAEA